MRKKPQVRNTNFINNGNEYDLEDSREKPRKEKRRLVAIIVVSMAKDIKHWEISKDAKHNHAVDQRFPETNQKTWIVTSNQHK